MCIFVMLSYESNAVTGPTGIRSPIRVESKLSDTCRTSFSNRSCVSETPVSQQTFTVRVAHAITERVTTGSLAILVQRCGNQTASPAAFEARNAMPATTEYDARTVPSRSEKRPPVTADGCRKARTDSRYPVRVESTRGQAIPILGAGDDAPADHRSRTTPIRGESRHDQRERAYS